MNLQPIQVDRARAHAAYLEYRRAIREQHSAEDELIMRGYREIARGRNVISLSAVIRAGGEDEQRRPRLAIARADMRWCYVRRHAHGGVAFLSSETERATWWHRKPASMRATIPGALPTLLSSERSSSARYQALNQLAIRGLWLALEAWHADPPEFFLWENVPRIATRGRAVLDVMMRMLEGYGYAVAETTHDCGELGNLAQSRKRFLLVARHRAKVPPFLYQPERRPLRAVGDVLGPMPLPGDPAAGPMHRMRELQWRTWVRLAFVEAGGDWRSLQRLAVADGFLRDFAIAPEARYHPGVYGVTSWADHAGTVTANATPNCGRFSVADPRPDWDWSEGRRGLGVTPWDGRAGAVTGQARPGQGAHSVADPRLDHTGEYGQLGVRRWEEPSGTVTGTSEVGGGRFAVADPRCAWNPNAYTGNGACAVADPRPGLRQGGDYQTAGHYGVVPWSEHSRAVVATAGHDNGPFSVADPRPAAGEPLPEHDARLVAVIRALDGTWHRPFTTLELAALQGLVDLGEHLELEGSADGAWRERIGNAVPSPTAAAIASVMGTTLLLAWAGETFVLSSSPIWVRPIVVALAVDLPETYS